jgi:hypothetical protein
MNCCFSCKYWGFDPVDKEDFEGMKPCSSPSGSYKCDGGDGNDGLYTKPFFGCNEWRQSES